MFLWDRIIFSVLTLCSAASSQVIFWHPQGRGPPRVHGSLMWEFSILIPALRQWLEIEWFVTIITGKGNFVKSKLSWQILFSSFRSPVVIGSSYICCHSDTWMGLTMENYLPWDKAGKDRAALRVRGSQCWCSSINMEQHVFTASKLRNTTNPLLWFPTAYSRNTELGLCSGLHKHKLSALQWLWSIKDMKTE